MRLLAILVLLLVLNGAEPRRGARNRGLGPGRERRKTRGKGRASAVKRFASDCKEYTEAGQKYLDCQDRQLTAVQPDWPKDIQHLLLGRNKIQVHTHKSLVKPLWLILCGSVNISPKVLNLSCIILCKGQRFN